MRIGFLGTGHIAAPMARHLAAKGHEVTVTERNAKVSARLAADIGATVTDPQGVIDASDVVILCLRPAVAREVLEPLMFRAGQAVVSVMAEVTRAELQKLCSPVTCIVQTIPLGFVEQGGCPLAAFGDQALLTGLFAPENPVVEVREEAHLNAHFAICAMVPGLLEMMAAGSDWLAQRTGDPAKAELYTTELVRGFLATIEQRTGGLAAERDALATPDTLSLMMVEGLRGRATTPLQEALTSVEDRLEGKS